VLSPAKIKVFVFLSVLMHAAFAVLFAEVTLSFPPPSVKQLSLSIMTRGGGRGEIIQSEAGWPMPKRLVPVFSAEKTLGSLGGEIPDWMEYRAPDPSNFVSRDALAPEINVIDLAAKAYEGAPKELFSHMPAEAKARPITDFALRPVAPKIFETD